MLRNHYGKWMPSEMTAASSAVMALDRILSDKWNEHRDQPNAEVEARSAHVA